MTSFPLKKLAVALGLVALCSSTWAAGLQVAPTMLTFQGQDTSEVLDLYNRSDAESTMQVRVFNWTQDKGEDLLEPATDVIASPPVQQVAADGHQVVRLVRTGPIPATDETAYRVLVDELPQAQKIQGAGVNMLLRFSVPVFVPPANGGKPVLKASWTTVDGKHQLSVENSGNIHAQLVAPALGDASSKAVVLNPGLYGYVLPHQVRAWTLPAGAADALFNHKGVSLKLQLNGTEVTLPIDAS